MGNRICPELRLERPRVQSQREDVTQDAEGDGEPTAAGRHQQSEVGDR
jgi:hypothetical protein